MKYEIIFLNELFIVCIIYAYLEVTANNGKVKIIIV